jgi:hypothetical protein
MLFYCCLIPSFLCLCLFHRCSSASGMFKIVRPAVGESVRYQILPGVVKAYIESVVFTDSFFFLQGNAPGRVEKQI